MIPVKWSRDAQRDLAGIDDYYRPLNSAAALKIARSAVGAARFLAGNPSAGEQLADGNVRRWRVARTPYLLLYRPEPAALRILRVIHASRDWTRFV